MNRNLVLEKKPRSIESYPGQLAGGVALWWLGQAGFLIRYGDKTILVDAYLSDALAVKYAGQRFPHKRMMPPPITMEELSGVDYLICSHAHSDHMDPGLLPVLKDQNPSCMFIIPEAVRETAIERGVPGERLVGLNAGDFFSLGDGAAISAMPAAHEKITTDSKGSHFFLGYFLTLGDYRLFHPGDCLVFDGMYDWFEPHPVDLALMPVNGRSEELSSRGIAGNFNMEEAYQIMMDRDITYMIPHHFGMFDFNTVSREELEAFISRKRMENRIYPAETGVMYHLIRK